MCSEEFSLAATRRNQSSVGKLGFNAFVFQECVEEELLGDLTDGPKSGPEEPLGSAYPHVLRALQQGQLAPADTRPLLRFSGAGGCF